MLLAVDLFSLSLPLSNPVLIFSLILFIILFAPILLNKLKIPYLIGLIIAGAIIGPNGLNLMLRDSSIILFGTVGLLYIMFLAGLEIDLADFRKNSGKSLVFGLYTFLIPMTIGIITSYYLLEYTLPTSILLASMFASHTLIAYPIISKLGVTKNRAVNIAVGGTLITDTLALLVLAAIVGMSTGIVNQEFWIRLGVSVIAFSAAVMFLFPLIGRWFFKRNDDNISQYIFVLAMVFLGAFMAEAAGIEAIIGAFLAGLALNRLIPHTSPLMNRVEFVGNALFIPFFLIGVGMLIDYRVFFTDLETIKVAAMMVIAATLSKFIAAWLTQKTFRYTADERRLIFGLSNAQAAATLAAVLVGYNIVLNQSEIDAAALAGIVVEPVRLLNESILNGTIVMILVTCTIASFVTQKGAQNIALSESADPDQDMKDETSERLLIPISNIESTDELVHLGVTVKSKNNKNGLYALHLIDSNQSGPESEKIARRILDKAAVSASATDNYMHELLRYDVNIVNGITNVVKEHKITDLILGLSQGKGMSDSFLGNLTEGILLKSNATTLVYKPVQPLATIKRHLVIIPDRAEKEIGFPFWLIKVWNLGRNTGGKLIFYAPEQTLNYIRKINSKHPVESEFREFSDWNDFLIISRDVKDDDGLIIIMSRKERLSHQQNMSKVPAYLNKYFQSTNFILVYPMQAGIDDVDNIDLNNPAMIEPFERLDEIGKTISNLFKRR
jgi:Kef-type K+ transport system membrane component KefB